MYEYAPTCVVNYTYIYNYMYKIQKYKIAGRIFNKLLTEVDYAVGNDIYGTGVDF